MSREGPPTGHPLTGTPMAFPSLDGQETAFPAATLPPSCPAAPRGLSQPAAGSSEPSSLQVKLWRFVTQGWGKDQLRHFSGVSPALPRTRLLLKAWEQQPSNPSPSFRLSPVLSFGDEGTIPSSARLARPTGQGQILAVLRTGWSPPQQGNRCSGLP